MTLLIGAVVSWLDDESKESGKIAGGVLCVISSFGGKTFNIVAFSITGGWGRTAYFFTGG